MDETAPPPGALLAFERLIDNFAFRLEVGETRIDADLDADLDAFAAASPEAAQAAAAALADRLAQADAPGSSSPAISSGILEIAKRRAVWRDSWRPAAPGDTASGPATKTLWLQADGLRALRVEFSLRDTITPLIPMADLAHLNGVMSKTATSVSIQNKRQFKKR